LAVQAQSFMQAIERSLERSASIRAHPGIPASPYRRMDAGAIGSLVGSYPLGLCPHDDTRMLQTVDYLLHNHFVHGLFFQEMFHSGLNVYLTLHLAQVLLRAGDRRFADLVTAVADFASPTGQWPEAIHPHTRGGCMGDGQHIWAAAEWVMMIRNMFVREEAEGLVLASGILQAWFDTDQLLSFGPTPTPYGDLTLWLEPSQETISVAWAATWRCKPALIRVALPGLQPIQVEDPDTASVTVSRQQMERFERKE
jgi:hypothetical protein